MIRVSVLLLSSNGRRIQNQNCIVPFLNAEAFQFHTVKTIIIRSQKQYHHHHHHHHHCQQQQHRLYEGNRLAIQRQNDGDDNHHHHHHHHKYKKRLSLYNRFFIRYRTTTTTTTSRQQQIVSSDGDSINERKNIVSEEETSETETSVKVPNTNPNEREEEEEEEEDEENDDNDGNDGDYDDDNEYDINDKYHNDPSRTFVDTSVDDKIIKERTMEWLKEIVIGMNLCPFADYPYRNGQVRVDVLYGCDEHTLLAGILAALWMREEKPGTTLVVCPDLYPNDFDKYWDFVQLIEQGLFVEYSELQGVLQVAPFHPLFRFERSSSSSEDEDYDNNNNDNNPKDNHDEGVASDYTNRSPYPMIHILREEEVSIAVEKIDGDASRVWVRNVDLLETLSTRLGKDVFQKYMRQQQQQDTTSSNYKMNKKIEDKGVNADVDVDENENDLPFMLTDEQKQLIQQTLREHKIQFVVPEK